MKIQLKMPPIEQRATSLFEPAGGVNLGAPELREDGAFPKIRGYAAVFNQLSQPLFMGIRERIRPGAFKQALAEGQDVRALVNHEPSLLLGRNKAGTLFLEEDQHGLRYVIDPPDTTAGRDIMVSLRRKDVTQSSFGFRVRPKGEEYNKENGEFIRDLVSVDLFDISPVTYPAYTQTSVSVRSLYPSMDETQVRSIIEPFYRDVKLTLDPPLHHLPECERKLRIRGLEMKAQTLREQQERERASLKVASVYFDKRSWTAERAKAWLGENGYEAREFQELNSRLRFVQHGHSQNLGEQEEVPEGTRGVILLVAKN